MGFSKDASEKALFMTMSTGQSVENALNWINEHCDDADFNEPLLIVGQSGEGELKQQYQGNLSKEERIKIAEEKIKAARIRRAEEEKVNALEAEKNRIASTKAQAAAKRKLEEQEQVNALAARKKDKEEFLSAKKQMLIQLERDRCERLGIPYNEKEALENIKKKE